MCSRAISVQEEMAATSPLNRRPSQDSDHSLSTESRDTPSRLSSTDDDEESNKSRDSGIEKELIKETHTRSV